MSDLDNFCNPDEADCPYTAFKETCKDHRDRCGKWVTLVAGKNAQTGEPIHQSACEDSWRPILAIEQIAAVEALDANVGLLRKEQTKRDATYLQIALEQLKALNFMTENLRKMESEMTRHNDGLIRLGQERLSDASGRIIDG